MKEIHRSIKDNIKNQLANSQTSLQTTSDDQIQYHYFENSATGIYEFDNALNGGFPKDHVILLAGSSGSGKTIFSFQWLFEGIKNNENGIYISMTEPLFKSVKHLEAMDFYNREAVEQEKIKFLDIREIYKKNGFNPQEIIKYVENHVHQTNAKRLCIDSITAIAYNLNDKAKIRQFIFELGKVLAAIGCTTVLTSEITEEGKFSAYGVEEFISDAIVRIDQIKQKNKSHRRIQIVKMRAKAYSSDDIFFKITKQGIVCFPAHKVTMDYSSSTQRISTGNEILNEMLEGGLLKGSTTLVTGSAGTGKSVLSTQFLMEGLYSDEICLYVGFEESKEQIIRNAESFGWSLREFEENSRLHFMCAYPDETFLDEHINNIIKIIEHNNITRCVFDSLSAVQNSFDEEAFNTFAKKINGYLKSKEITTLFTAVSRSLIGASSLSESHMSSITDNIIMLRYVEMQGDLSQIIHIIKTRGSSHNKALRSYKIKENGLHIGESLKGFEGILTGVSRKVSGTISEKIEQEFKRFIGPMGKSVFEDVKQKGLTESNVITFINEKKQEGILTEQSAAQFINSIEYIFGKNPTSTINVSSTPEPQKESTLNLISKLWRKQ